MTKYSKAKSRYHRGNSGMGLATAKRFVAEGAHVVITGRRQEQIDIALKEIGAASYRCQGDVANMKDLERFYQP